MLQVETMPESPLSCGCIPDRTLFGEDGRFIVDNINEWQHSAMYSAFMLSGVVDLVGFYAPQGTLPVGTEQVQLPA